ncbi:24134_t:CDS:1, partial [Gigaspora rosea]
MHQEVIEISKLVRIMRKYKDSYIEKDVQEKINWTIQGINERLGTLIPHVGSIVKDEH